MSPNFVSDTSDLAEVVNQYLQVADGGRSDDLQEVDFRLQAMSTVLEQYIGIYGTNLAAG